MARGVTVIIVGMATALSGLAGAAHAQLADPTRPSGATGQAAESMSDKAAPASGLQSVILRKQGKPAALINGEVVELGGKVGEARLVKVSEDAVVLKGPGGEETLRLIPAAEKKIIKVGAGGTANSGTPAPMGTAKKGSSQ